MSMTIEELYNYLKKHLIIPKLQELSLQLIDAHKAKNHTQLKAFADFIFTDRDPDVRGTKLFLQLIKYFHPDRMNFFLKEITAAFQAKDREKLEFYKRIVTSGKNSGKSQAERFAYTFTEKEEYSRQDFGYYEEEAGDNLYDNVEEVDEVMDFLKAVKAEFIGNLDLDFDPADLSMLDGELFLADYGIYDLYGLDYCVNIISLNLSHNHISDIYEVQFLSNLEELYLADNEVNEIDCLKSLQQLQILDLSANAVEDISVLLELENLQFVDLRNNPLRNLSQVKALSAKSVNVIYDF